MTELCPPAPRVRGGDDRRQRVAVVVPCHDQAHFLEDCLQSLCAQTWGRWRAAVVDDASPDSDQIHRVVERADDPRITVVSHGERRGPAAARNTGVAATDEPLVAFLDADDRVDPVWLERLVAALSRDEGADLAHPLVQRFGRRDDPRPRGGPRDGRRVLSFEETIPIAGMVARRSALQRLGGFDEHEVLRCGREDFEFSVRAFAAGCRALSVDEPLYLQRVSHTNLGREARRRDHEVAAYVHGKHRAVFEASGAGRPLLARAFRDAAIATHQKGDTRAARRLAWKAFRLAPSAGHLRTAVRAALPKRVHQAWQRGEVRRIVPFLGYPLHGEERYRPFFVIGVARSGNTLFRRILTAHPDLHVPPETFVLGVCVQKWQRWGRRLNWPDLVALILAEFEFHPEWHTFDAWLGPLAQRLTALPRGQRDLAHVLDAFYRYHAEVHGQALRRWGDKTPMNSLDDRLVRGEPPRRIGEGVPETLERLRAVFPDAQFLHIVRDGCDVAYSHLRGFFMSDVEEAAVRWLHVVRQCRRFTERHPGQCLELRYEDLIGSPEPTIRRVCEFLEVPFDPGMLTSEQRSQDLGDVPAWVWHRQARQPINPANTGKGRAYFSPAQRRTLQRILGIELERLGYPPATAPAPPAVEVKA